MMTKLRTRLSFANLIALAALFVALGGGAYALTIPAGSVGTRQLAKNAVTAPKIKRNAVTSPKVRDSSLRASDFAPGELPAGERGPQGVQGEPGPFPAVLPSGKTLTGAFGLLGHGEENNGLEIVSGDISFAFPLASPPSVRVMQIGTASSPPECPGTAAAPAAAPGWLCVYENRQQNERPGGYPNVSAPGSGASPTASRFGAVLSEQGQASGTGWFFWSEGTWAVTAP